MQLFSFTPEETATILELARRATADADLFDEMAEKLDIADHEMSALGKKLHFALEYPDANIQLNTREEDEHLVLDGETANDYTLAEGRTNAWIAVDGYLVKVARRAGSVVAEIFHRGNSDFEVLADCSVDVESISGSGTPPIKEGPLPTGSEEEQCRQCNDPASDGEGYDGLCGSCADKNEGPHIRVEYDSTFYGGDYSGVGNFAYIPLAEVSENSSLEDAFEKQTGLPRVHIIHFSMDELWNAYGVLYED